MMSWIAFLEGFASAAALIAAILAFMSLSADRTNFSASLYIAHCDVAMAYPELANPDLAKLDLRERSLDGDKAKFERYEWYVARLIYVLDAAIRLEPLQQWRAVAQTQLGNHRHYFASDYYARQDYLSHYSPTMRRLIRRQRAA